MQAVESETVILYHTDLRGQWPEAAARELALALRYHKRLATLARGAAARASLAGIALALRALGALTGRRVAPGEIVFARGAKPALAGSDAGPATPPPDFSISHSGPWVGCAAVGHGRVGFDVELGGGARIADWVAREAALKACGAGLPALREVELAAGRARCRGVELRAHAVELFPGARACVMTSRADCRLSARALTLEELFAR